MVGPSCNPSLHKFLASEVMHYLGVATTRALSLVHAKGNRVHCAWYSNDAILSIPDMDDIRLAQYAPKQCKEIIANCG